MLWNKYKNLLDNYNINTPLRLAHLFAQLEHESGLKPISENLNYSARRLLQIFPNHFDENTAKLYAGQPERIANKVYANRMGNGNEASGDGWRYRGRGFIQITGKNNYILLSKDTRIEYILNPDMLLKESDAMISALWYWSKNNLNKLADRDNIIEVTRGVNGGLNGLTHRRQLLDKYKRIFKA